MMRRRIMCLCIFNGNRIFCFSICHCLVEATDHITNLLPCHHPIIIIRPALRVWIFFVTDYHLSTIEWLSEYLSGVVDQSVISVEATMIKKIFKLIVDIMLELGAYQCVFNRNWSVSWFIRSLLLWKRSSLLSSSSSRIKSLSSILYWCGCLCPFLGLIKVNLIKVRI